MTTVAQLKQFLEKNYKDDEQIFIAVDEDNETSCVVYSAEEIIDEANEVGGSDDEDTDDKIEDIDTAISYLADMNSERYFLEIET